MKLLLEAAQCFAPIDNFALKGGNAINLFTENMPRLSFDLDFAFCDGSLRREEALFCMRKELETVCRILTDRGLTCRLGNRPTDTKCSITKGQATVTVEVNTIFRGTLLPVLRRTLCQRAQTLSGRVFQVPVLDSDELFAGKFVATLDRQHPRDLYDVRRFWQRGQMLTKPLLDCFIVYLVASNRPAHEVLFGPDRLDERLFYAVTQATLIESCSWSDLKCVRQKLQKEIVSSLTEDHRRFLFSMTKAEPCWNLLPFEGLQKMPAVKWKLENLKKLKESNRLKFEEQAEALEKGFERFDR